MPSSAVASSLIFVACIAPWTIRNYVVFHSFIPLRSNFGLELWLDNHTQFPDRSFHPVDYQPELDKYLRMTEIPYMEEKEREAFAFVRAYPADAAQFALHRFVGTWMGISESPVDLWRTTSLVRESLYRRELRVFVIGPDGRVVRSPFPKSRSIASGHGFDGFSHRLLYHSHGLALPFPDRSTDGGVCCLCRGPSPVAGSREPARTAARRTPPETTARTPGQSLF